jgi:Zn-finger nucleic acid-binding protein
MKCPRCEIAVLDERERDSVTIDVCPQCRGIWLDRGELERLIARAIDEQDALARRGGPDRHDHDDQERHGDRERYDQHHDHEDHRYNSGHGRKRSWFDIFD